MDLKNISNENLLINAKKLCADERRITAEVLHHLKEIEFRRLHLQRGYASIYEYAIRELGYSEAAAYRRVSAMRLLKSVPEIDDKIKTGALSLDGAAKIQKFINHQRKEATLTQRKFETSNKPSFETKADKLNLIQSLENKSAKEIEKAIVLIDPSVLKQEKLRQISEEKIELKIVIDEELMRTLDLLKSILSHKNPNMTYNELIKYLAQMGIKKLDPSQKVLSKNLPKQKNSEIKSHAVKPNSLEIQRGASPQRRNDALKKSRYIPATVKQEVYMRDKGCCSYTDPQSKRKCVSKHLLQYDHRYPFSLGGESSVKNLRLLCFQHHQLLTENVREMGL